MSTETSQQNLDLAILTKHRLQDLCRGILPLSRKESSTKDALINAILTRGTPDFLHKINDEVKQSVIDTLHTQEQATGSRKRRRADEAFSRRVAQRYEDEPSRPDWMLDHDTSQYMALPSNAEVKKCYERFYNATSMDAVRTAICGVCARELGEKEHRFSSVALQDIPNRHRLIPKEPHPAHDLFLDDGILLEPRGIITTPPSELAHDSDTSTTYVRICHQCLKDLSTSCDTPPPLSLANNLWVGAVPLQLQVLTFPEQLLIAQLYPRVYVFKLFPKVYRPKDPSTLQRGIRGNVTTYDLNNTKIADMIGGKLLPRPLSILPSILSVTFIGLGDLPKYWLRSTFRVRRQVILEALLWLKANNSKYYGDVNIDAARIHSLPHDDVPDEIMSIIRHLEDTSTIDHESEGYVPESDGDSSNPHEREQEAQSSGDCGTINAVTQEVKDSSEVPDVIPLQVSGTIDTDLSKITANELMLWGLANLWKEGKEGGYTVRHGTKPVCDFGKARNGEVLDAATPNFFEKAFPCLFPYGVGGIEGYREVEVNFAEHIQWALEYHDRRFRKHETFPFVAFGISQRRESLASARIQISQQHFDRDLHLLSTITSEKLERARQQEENGQYISDPAVRLLQKHVYGASSHVKGSDQARYQLRSQIWSTSTVLGPPSLWITINPSDIHNPIAQVFAGENIDLDNFLSANGPNSGKRARNIAADPFAAAKFFHFLISTVLEMLLGVKVTSFQVKSSFGVLGRVAAYFGTVETQGRGTLHLHLIVWLFHTPNGDKILELLKSAEFRDRIIAYIRANLRAYVPGLESEKDVKAVPHDPEVSFSRPPNPLANDYDEQLKIYEQRLARTTQVHTCQVRRCLFLDQYGQYRCKRRAPFDRHTEDFIDENGNWGQKRLYEYVNGWCPAILVNCACNCDAKLLTSGEDTRDVMFYVTAYSAKKQGRNYNASAVMSKAYSYHLDRLGGSGGPDLSIDYVDQLRDTQRLLIFRIIHAMNREQELAAPLVMSYLMGWGDTYRSHHYAPIYWSSFVRRLLQAFPLLAKSKSPSGTSHGDEPQAENHIEDKDTNDTAQVDMTDGEKANDTATLDFDSAGTLYTKSQFTDYCTRGYELEDFNIIEFFVNTYESRLPKAGNTDNDNTASQLPETDISQKRQRGRPPNNRVPFLNIHPKHKHICRIMRSAGHHTLPNFIGHSFPRRDDPDNEMFYHASMLMLLKPWRSLCTDLKNLDETWSHAFETFMRSSEAQSKRAQDILSGIQYFHSCRLAAERSREQDDGGSTTRQGQRAMQDVLADDDDEFELGGGGHNPSNYTEEGLAALVASQTSSAELLHARLAIELGRRGKIFSAVDEDHWLLSPTAPNVSPATGDDITRLMRWKTQMEADVARQNLTHADEQVETAGSGTNADIGLLSVPAHQAVVEYNNPIGAEPSLSPVDPSQLRSDQRRAYDIVTWHLDKTLSGEEPPPLRMIVQGEGGTGKSKVIQTITEAFNARGAQHLLVKSAYTGVAASLIDGKTTHTISGISLFKDDEALSDEAKGKLQQFWHRRRYLIIDEFSMLAKSFFARLSRNISIGKQGSPGFLEDTSFGGVNVIICGDFHQFPPVAKPMREALYYESHPALDSVDSQLGRAIYEEFSIVVSLKEQMRVTDLVWLDFLRHLRFGQVNADHLSMLRQLIIGRPGTPAIQFDVEPWNNTSLVTPRHAVRLEWNQAALRKACQELGNPVYICASEDTIKGRPLTIQEKYCLESRNLQQKGGRRGNRRKKDLPRELELAIGMKVMVTDNIETDLDVTNGARGEITNIILHPEEGPLEEGPIIRLRHLPICVLVRLYRTRATALEGLNESVIPVEPATTSYRVKFQLRSGETTQKTIQRCQFPMTGAYAFTDYRSQGQTLPNVIVDIASPPTGSPLNLFNLYVALSRSAGRSTIRLLRDFDDNVFLASHTPELRAEDDRIEKMNNDTILWYNSVVKN